MNTDELGSGIVAIQRKARFADTPFEEWATRLEHLIASQPGTTGAVVVTNVRPVGTAAGGSNGTLLFNAEFNSGAGPVNMALVLRFLPVKGLFHRYDVRGQFELQRALEASQVPVPRQLWLDETGRFLTRPGYVMQQVPGVSTPMTWMTSGLIAESSAEDRRKITREYVRALALVHAVDWRSLGLQWLEGRAAGSRPIEREVNWYWDSLLWADGDGAHPQQLAPVRDWLIANEPADIDVVLCHGDANFGNYLYDGTDITAVVDWEMGFLGTPECDLSFIKVGDAIMQSETPWPEGALSYDEMRAEYERISGRTLRHMEYFELFSAYRVAVINVLAMKHFPQEVLTAFMPVLRRGPMLCLERAAALGVPIRAGQNKDAQVS
jgi:aminoglycoside phosphotransferase (APT) family kinase protein